MTTAVKTIGEAVDQLPPAEQVAYLKQMLAQSQQLVRDLTCAIESVQADLEDLRSLL